MAQQRLERPQRDSAKIIEFPAKRIGKKNNDLSVRITPAISFNQKNRQ